MNKETALIYGILIGDGCLSNSSNGHYVVVTCSIYDDGPFFDNTVIPLLTELRGKNVNYKKRPKHGKIEIRFCDKTLFHYFKGLGFPVGKKGNISIPESLPEEFWKYVISGIFATDGSLVIADNNGIEYPRIEIQSISEALLKQIKGFLANNDMRGNVYRLDRSGKIIYRLEFPGRRNLEKFRNVVGFINPKHEEKYNKIKSGLV